MFPKDFGNNMGLLTGCYVGLGIPSEWSVMTRTLISLSDLEPSGASMVR